MRSTPSLALVSAPIFAVTGRATGQQAPRLQQRPSVKSGWGEQREQDTHRDPIPMPSHDQSG